MADMEKVIKGLERCAGHDGMACLSCPYNNTDCVDDLCADALELLKELKEDNFRLDRENQKLIEQMAQQPNVVRCKDCKYCFTAGDDYARYPKCEFKHNWMPQPDWFCADGERK